MYYDDINKCKNFNIYQDNNRKLGQASSAAACKNLQVPKIN